MQSFMFHPTLAPRGKKVPDADIPELEKTGWVDTPAKFGKAAPAPEPEPERAANVKPDEPGSDEDKAAVYPNPEIEDAEHAPTGPVDGGEPHGATLEEMPENIRNDAIDAMDKDQLQVELKARDVSPHPNTGEVKLRAALRSYFD